MKRGWVLGLLALLVLPCSAQQIMYSNLKELVEGRGDTVTILKVEKRSKNQNAYHQKIQLGLSDLPAFIPVIISPMIHRYLPTLSGG